MKQKRIKYGVLALLLCLGVAGLWRSGVLAGTKTPAVTPESVTSVKTVVVEPVNKAPELSFTATLEGQTAAAVSAKIAGRIEKILVEEGQAVAAGDALVQLEAVEVQNAARQAGDGVTKAQAAYELALKDYHRYETLYQNGAISEQQLDTARAKLKTAEADVSSAAANQGSAEQQYRYATITAPVAGVVTNKTATLGQVVSPGASLLTVQDTRQMYAVIQVEQQDIGQITPGQTAEVTLDAYPGMVFTGKVEVLNPEAGAGNRMFRTKIKLDNPDGRLKAGMFAKVRLSAGESRPLLLVPQSAVLQKQGLYYVFVVEQGKAVRRQVSVGEVQGSDIVIADGLQAGQQVITTSVNRLKEGEALKMIP